jgi:hypothetical protein
MRAIAKCPTCGQTCVCYGIDEPDVDAFTPESFIDPCCCIEAGGEVEIVEWFDDDDPFDD